MEPEINELTLVCKDVCRKGKWTIGVTMPGNATFTDSVDLLSSAKREEFAARVVSKYPGVPQSLLIEKLNELAAEKAGLVALTSPQDVNDDQTASAKQQLIRIGTNPEYVELFRDSSQDDADAWATIRPERGRPLTAKVTSQNFERWLTREYYRACGGAPPSQALVDAVRALEAIALFDGPVHPVHVRLAGDRDGIWIDLCDDEGQVVHVTKDAWRVRPSSECPIRFLRAQGMLALPVPVRGGSISQLRPLVNTPSDESWRLLVGFMIGMFNPAGPYAVLIVDGEQGSAKTTTCNHTRGLVDPHRVMLRRPPRTEQDLMLAASANRVVGFDNISRLSQDLADCISSLATGAGFGTRLLFKNEGEKLITATRPFVINGINGVGGFPDLLDRAVALTLPQIPDEQRRTAEEVQREYDAVRPGVLGALLDAVCVALARYDEVVLPKNLRMADFVRWVTAAEPALGWTPGLFFEDMVNNRVEMRMHACESFSIGQPLLEFMEERDMWEGTCEALRNALGTDEQRSHKDWPRNAEALRSALRRIAPSLRGIGIDIKFGARASTRQRQRLVTILRTTEGPPDGGERTVAPPSDSPDSELSAESGLGEGLDAVADSSDSLDGFFGVAEPGACSEASRRTAARAGLICDPEVHVEDPTPRKEPSEPSELSITATAGSGDGVLVGQFPSLELSAVTENRPVETLATSEVRDA